MKQILFLLLLCCLGIARAEDITLKTGVVLKNATVTKRDPSSVTFSHDDGILKVWLAELPEELQKKFDFDALRSAEFIKAQADVATKMEIDERSRKAAKAIAEKPTPELNAKQKSAAAARAEASTYSPFEDSKEQKEVKDAALRQQHELNVKIYNLERKLDTSRQMSVAERDGITLQINQLKLQLKESEKQAVINNKVQRQLKELKQDIERPGTVHIRRPNDWRYLTQSTNDQMNAEIEFEITCDDAGIQKHAHKLIPINCIPSKGETIRLDGVWFECVSKSIRMDKAIAYVELELQTVKNTQS